MKYITIFQILCCLALLGITACSNSTSGPNLPPTPQGSIVCHGHVDVQGEAMIRLTTDVSYAYWTKPDSNSATLTIGYLDTRNRPTNTVRDTIYLEHTNSGWLFAPQDRRASYYDTAHAWYDKTKRPFSVEETTDSVYFSISGSVPGIGTGYFLKK